MTRRKADKAAKLNRIIGLRVSDSFYTQLEKWLINSNCQSVTELARSILYREEIIWKHTDGSLESVTDELAGIRNELNAMGRNINQITHYFHTTDSEKQKLYASLKVKEEYKKVGEKVNKLLSITAEISKKWLQK